jgi:hypothetical protein
MLCGGWHVHVCPDDPADWEEQDAEEEKDAEEKDEEDAMEEATHEKAADDDDFTDICIQVDGYELASVKSVVDTLPGTVTESTSTCTSTSTSASTSTLTSSNPSFLVNRHIAMRIREGDKAWYQKQDKEHVEADENKRKKGKNNQHARRGDSWKIMSSVRHTQVGATPALVPC